jgi:hypothetical protein
VKTGCHDIHDNDVKHKSIKNNDTQHTILIPENKMALCVTTFSIKTLSVMTLSIMTLSIMTFGIMAFTIMAFSITLGNTTY